MRTFLFPLALLLISPAGLAQTTWYVPDQFATIQEAVDACAVGDTVVVRPGEYLENIDLRTDGVSIVGEQGALNTSIVGQGWDTVNVSATWGISVSLTGFVIRGGANGVRVMTAPYGAPHVLTLDSCIIGGNDESGVVAEGAADLILINCLVRNNGTRSGTGAGVLVGDLGGAILFNCTVTANKSLDGAGVLVGGSGAAIVKDSIVWGNTSTSGNEMSGSISASYSCIRGGWFGTGNISSDPLFVDAANGHYHLKQYGTHTVHSPAVDAGDPNSPVISGSTRIDGLQDLGVLDMGYHYPRLGPDLEITAMTFFPATVQENGSIQVDYTIENVGTAPCGVSTRLGFYLSLDDVIKLDDIRVGNLEGIPDLQPGGSYSNTVWVDVGGNPGSWYFGGYADKSKQIWSIELNTVNGYSAGPITITTAPPPPTLSVSNAVAGQSATLTCVNANGPMVFFAGSITGPGPTYVASLGITLDLSPRICPLGESAPDASGTAIIGFPVPPSLAGQPAWLQAVDGPQGARVASNMVAVTIQ